MEKAFFLSLMETQAAHMDVSRQGFARLGLSDGLPKILYILRKQDGCVQKKLAESCNIRESTMTVLLKRLAQKGYIRKEPVLVSGGKRAYGIYLTDAGRAKAEEVCALTEQVDEQSLRGFSKAEREQLLRMLMRVRINLLANE